MQESELIKSGNAFMEVWLPGIFVCAIASLVVSAALLWMYRRRVLELMRQGAVANVAENESQIDVSAVPIGNPIARLDMTVFRPSHSTSLSRAGAALADKANRLVRENIAIYAVAGLTYSLVFAIAAKILLLRISVGDVVTLTLWFAWPMVLVINIIAVKRWRSRLSLVLAYFVLLFVVSITAETLSPSPEPVVDFDVPPELFLAPFSALATIGLAAIVVRPIRAIAPLVMIPVAAGAFGFSLGYAIPNGDGRTTLALLCCGVGCVMGWLALRLVVSRYSHKQTSDQAVMVAAIWMFFCTLHPSALTELSDVRIVLVGPVAFATFVIVSKIGFALRRHLKRVETPGPRLLVLRVFALGGKSREMLDILSSHWRSIGSIQLIAGPDLATSTVEPNEFLDFIGRRLGQRVIVDETSLSRQLDALDVGPDADGRYRTTDFICAENMWRGVLKELALHSDAVLVDVRRFSQQNAGTRYELEALVELAPLRRVVLVVDETTDERLLRDTLREAWSKMKPQSPNMIEANARFTVFRAYKSERRSELFGLLCDAASAPSESVLVSN